MNAKRVYLIFIILVSVFLTSCQIDKNADCREEFFVSNPTSFEDIPLINTEMTIEVVEQSKPYKIGDSVFLWVENHSEQSIIITIDEQLKIMRATSQENIYEIIDDKTNLMPSTLVLGPSGSESSGAEIIITPKLYNEGNQEEIFIDISGNEWRDGLYCPKVYIAMLTFYLEP